MKYTSLYLIGFRAVGKSTIGKAVAQSLQLPFVEMDDEIVEVSGKSIPELTKNGTSWELFRKQEHEAFVTLLSRSSVVVGTGGGTLVNSLYGEKNAMLLRQTPTALPILLTAEDKIIQQRIRQQEMDKQETKRPILDEQRASQLQQKLQQYDNQPAKQKEILVEAIIEDSMTIYQQRKPLYAHITNEVIDTGELSVQEAVDKIILLYTSP